MTETAARWIRVSSGGQDEANQLPDLDQHITSHGYSDGPVYTLHDVNASKGEQDTYVDQVIADARAGKLDVLVGWHVDRLDRRGPWATGDFVRKLNAAGVRVETTSEGVVSDRDLNGLVKQWQAREESEHKAERVRIAHAARKSRGSITSGVGWGYSVWCEQCKRWSEGRPECRQHHKIPAPTDTGRAYAKEVYSRAISGQSLRSISAWLSAATGQTITDTGVRNILTKPIYTGRHVYGDGSVCECEALVTADMQEQARKALAARLRRGSRSSVTEPALLIPTCLDCGKKAYRTLTGGKVRTYAYYCRTCRHQLDCKRLEISVMAYAIIDAANEVETVQDWREGSDSASEKAAIVRAGRELDITDPDYLEKASALRDAFNALPDEIKGHFVQVPVCATCPGHGAMKDECLAAGHVGRTKAEAILAIEHDRAALRALYAKWGVSFAMGREAGSDTTWYRVKVNGGPVCRRKVVLPPDPDQSQEELAA